VAINDFYYTILDNPPKGLNTIDLHSLVMHILNSYTQISQPDLDDNMTNFHSSIGPGPPLAVYTRKQEKCQVFAADAGIPIFDKTMITTCTKHALVCSNMTLAWREWKRQPLPNHTCPNWKSHRMAAFAKMSDINPMTARDAAFDANQAAELKQVQQMASSLNNMAIAAIQTNTTIKNLVATNAMLTKAIAYIQLSIRQICTTRIPSSPTSTAPTLMKEARICPSHWNITKPA
jgi:hypothetical protein